MKQFLDGFYLSLIITLAIPLCSFGFQNHHHHRIWQYDVKGPWEIHSFLCFVFHKSPLITSLHSHSSCLSRSESFRSFWNKLTFVQMPEYMTLTSSACMSKTHLLSPDLNSASQSRHDYLAPILDSSFPPWNMFTYIPFAFIYPLLYPVTCMINKFLSCCPISQYFCSQSNQPAFTVLSSGMVSRTANLLWRYKSLSVSVEGFVVIDN